jgi:hypothetical protein
VRPFVLLALLFTAGCSNTGLNPDALARRACTSEGMWCQDDHHSRCCRGLRCEDGRCIRRDAKGKDDRDSL